MSEFGDNLFMGGPIRMQHWLDCESARVDAADADALGNNEQNHGDNGSLSVTCAQAVTHTIARDGIVQAFCATHRIYTLLDTGHW